MKKTWFAAAAAAAILTGSLASGAHAFNDLEGVAHADKIVEMRERGIVSGTGNNKFAPHEKLSAQTALPLIVKTLNLSLAAYTFIKEPQASDYFTKIPNDAWYAEAFVIAQVNGLPIDKDIIPNEPVTREQFVHWLMHGLQKTGEYAFTEIYYTLKDEKQVSEGFMNSIQTALNGGIVELNQDQAFRPQEPITRAEAVVMARNALKIVESQQQPPRQDPIQSGEVNVSKVKVNADIQKIVLDMGEKPHPGWKIAIVGIDFTGESSAVVRYSVQYPDPAALYPMVISYPKAATYLSSAITDIRYEHVLTDAGAVDPDTPVSSGPAN
ncbi:S-layer homology domain-containing protein [Paenibacillus sp.]|uniref:S-layer homology domain-containing protein n=1 Tax=Paenibacillus sp. TaxID=58172 RepID=UPI002D41426E|nr:S-layer homology domain-containing protein [Paenibacillus sp.]HZG88204.1 S-layer homology domain-containing protein [Paenibacillus sp.]